ncbi:MAG: phytanoyl-CoA dioxygenase family protein [Phycisphaerae bacterium]|nr:phytanoyl-CoA dioxygenase family protein [Phycisphaerae bacterium]
MTSPTATRPGPTTLEAYQRDGLVVQRALLDPGTYIEPMQTQIRVVIDLARAEAGLGPTTGDAFDAGLAELLDRDRGRAGKVYDAVRKLPAFFNIVNAPPIWSLVKTLLDTELPGWFAAGSGVRMDHPGEDRHLSPWHQDYQAHLCSEDMVVVWIPLVPVDETAGPVVFCPGSHRDGMLPVYLDDPLNEARVGARAMEFVGASERAAGYEQRLIDSGPGDVLAFHGLVLHRSSPNRSTRTRWSMQLRYFNFLDPAARRRGWVGGVNAGVDLSDIHPELIRKRPS